MTRRWLRPSLLAALIALIAAVPAAIAGGNGCERGATVCEGTSGADRLATGNSDDLIRGNGGNDGLNAQGGDDELYGGAGNDTLHAGTGDDKSYGDGGRDIILGDERGAGGRDIIEGGPGSDRLFAITSLVVLLSVVFHGTGIALFLRKKTGEAGGPTAEPSAARKAPAPAADERVPERITLDELRQLRDAGEPVVLADVRTERSYRDDSLHAQGAIRLSPDEAVGRARELGLEHHATVVLYCA